MIMDEVIKFIKKFSFVVGVQIMVSYFCMVIEIKVKLGYLFVFID